MQRLTYRVHEWDPDFYNYMQDLKALGKPVILCGDLNVCAFAIDLYYSKNKDTVAGYTKGERNSFRAL